MVYSRAIEDKFLTHLCSDQGISEKYSDAMAEEWTEAATMALVKAGEEAFKDQAVKVTGAAKGHVDPYRRSEYFTADVVVYDDDSWGPPLLVAEHENQPNAERLQYTAWKLYCLEAEHRVLVGYYEPGSSVPTFKEMCRLVEEVMQDHPGKDILLLGAKWGATPQTAEEVRRLFKSQIIGTLPF